MKDFEGFLGEKMNLANLPTPIRSLENVKKTWGFEEFLMKEDYLTGFLESGNKVRKLEYLFKDAFLNEANMVFTCGGVQSNHARATAVVARKLGIEPVLFLRVDEKPDLYKGNLLIDFLIDSKVHYISSKEYERIDEIFNLWKERYEREGYKVYLIPEGGSNEIGVFGYMNAVLEMNEQMDLSSVDAITCAVGSVGTLLGLVLGLKLVGGKIKVVGFNVTKRGSSYFHEKIERLMESMKRRWKDFNLKIESDDYEIIDDFSGPAYAVPTDEDYEMILNIAKMESVILDQVYTSKAFRGTVETFKNRGLKVLFIHTGGTFGIFAVDEEITKVLLRRKNGERTDRKE